MTNISAPNSNISAYNDYRPRTMAALHRVKKLRLAELDEKIARVILARAYNIFRASGVPADIPGLLGVAAYRRVCEQRRLLSLQELLIVAKRTGMRVDLHAHRYIDGGSIPFLCTGLGTSLNRASLVAFMERLAFGCEEGVVCRPMSEYIRTQIELTRCGRTPIYWSNLIAFCAACGYKLSVWLSDNSRPDEPELLSRLNYPG